MTTLSKQRTIVTFLVTLIAGIILIIITLILTGLWERIFGPTKVEVVNNYLQKRDTILINKTNVSNQPINENKPSDYTNTLTAKSDFQTKKMGKENNTGFINATQKTSKSHLADEGNEEIEGTAKDKNDDIKDKRTLELIPEIKTTDLTSNECEIYDGMTYAFYGQACFENQTDYDLVLKDVASSAENEYIIPKGGKFCHPRIRVMTTNDHNENRAFDCYFNFKTLNTTPTKLGTFVVTLEKCKIKSVVLTTRNFYLRAP